MGFKMTDILPPAGWPNVRQLETNEFASGGANGNMNEQAKSLAARSELLKQYAALPYESKTSGYALNERVQIATGDIVRSTIASNVNNPNENMTGWVLSNSDSQIQTWSGRTQEEKNKDFLSIEDFGGKFDGSINDAIISHLPSNKPIYVPSGIFKFTITPPQKFYGEGVIQVAGYDYYLDQGIPTYLTNSTVADENDSTSECYPNIYVGQISGQSHTANCRANTAFGYKTLNKASSGARLTAVGKGALALTPDGYSSTAFGCDALGQGIFLDRSIGVGDNALKWLGTPDPVGTLHDFHKQYSEITPDPAVGYGFVSRWATIRADLLGTNYSTPNSVNLPTLKSQCTENVAVGRNSLLHSIKGEANTSVGYNALAHAYTSIRNTAIGRAAGRDCLIGSENLFAGYHAGIQQMSGNGNVMLGAFAGYNLSHTDYMTFIGQSAGENFTSTATNPSEKSSGARRTVAIGVEAMSDAKNSSFSVAVGNQAAKNTTASNIVAIGSTALMAGGGSFSVAIGSQSLPVSTSGVNTAVGYRSGLAVTTGSENVFIGYRSGEGLTGQNQNTFVGHQTGTTSNFNNCSILGYGAQTTADKQVQLGNSTTTTYVYGTVQNRSDERDKADIRDTELGLDFINSLRPVDYKWDMRDDYVQVDEDGNVTKLSKDGSKKRNRYHHGFIAQEIPEGFGGYQEHKINGGADVLSLGYDEFIAPLVKAVQELTQRVAELEADKQE